MRKYKRIIAVLMTFMSIVSLGVSGQELTVQTANSFDNPANGQGDDAYSYSEVLFDESFDDAKPDYDIKAGNGYKSIFYSGYTCPAAEDMIDSAVIKKENGNLYASVSRFGTPDYGKKNTMLSLWLNENGASLQGEHKSIGLNQNFSYHSRVCINPSVKSSNSGLFIDATSYVHSAYINARVIIIDIVAIEKNKFRYRYQYGLYNESSGAWEDKTSETKTAEGIDLSEGWADIDLDVNNTECKYSLTINGTKIISDADMLAISRNERREPNINCVRMGINRGAAYEGEYCFDDFRISIDRSEQLNAAKAELDRQMTENVDLSNLTQDIALADSAADCCVTWQSDNTDAIETDGTVHRRNFTQNAVLAAEISVTPSETAVKNAYVKAFYDVCVPKKETATTEETLNEIAQLLLCYEKICSEPINAVTKNLNFPSELPDGASIEWKSSGTAILTDGTVVRPEIGEKAVEVEVEAVLRLGEAELTIPYKFTVLPQISLEQMLQEAAEAIDYEILTDESCDAITSDLRLPSKGLHDSTIVWTSDDEIVISAKGEVKRGNENKWVTLTATFTVNGQSINKRYIFCVLMSEKAMAQHDVDAVVLNGLDEIISDFELPTEGSIYKSGFNWRSTCDALTIEENCAVVNRPLYGAPDSKGELVLTSTFDGVVVTRSFPVTVLAFFPDSDYVENEYNLLTFDKLSAEPIDSVTKNLSLPAVGGDGVRIVWESKTPNTVTNDGIVLRNTEGETVQAIISANIYKEQSVKTKDFTFYILPFESDEEAIEKAFEELSFHCISNQSIRAVTKNLKLPQSWRYGTSIEWVSGSERLLELQKNGDVIDGVIHAANAESGSENVLLTAKISGFGMSREKIFSITVLCEEQQYVIWKQNMESMQLGNVDTMQTTLPESVWEAPVDGICNIEIVQDPDVNNAQNKVLAFTNTQIVNYTGRPINYFRYRLGKKYKGDFVIKSKIYIPSENTKTLGYELIGGGGARVAVYFTPGKLNFRYLNSEGRAEMIYNENISYPRDKWFELEITTNTYSESFQAYIDGECITGPSDLYYANGEKYDNPLGDDMGMQYYQHFNDVESVRFGVVLSEKVEQYNVWYLDDVSVVQLGTVEQKLSEESALYEMMFLSSNRVSDITGDLILPNWKNKYTEVKLSSSNPDVISNYGKLLMRGYEDIYVDFTVTFTLNEGTLKRTFSLKVPKLNRQDNFENEVEWVRNYLRENYLITALTDNIRLPDSYENASIKWISSNLSVISESGVINRGESDIMVNLTARVTDGDNTEELTFEVCVKKKDATVKSDSKFTGSRTQGAIKKPTSDVEQLPNDSNDENAKKELFDDIKKHWARTQIEYLANKGVISGVGNNLFEPDANITRAQVVKMVVKSANGVAENDEIPFKDISVDDWCYPYVAVAYHMGLVNGQSAETFGAENEITRQELAVIIYRAIDNKQIKTEKQQSEFTDMAEIEAYAREAVEYLSAIGIIQGNEENCFMPNSLATRAEVAVMLCRMILNCND